MMRAGFSAPVVRAILIAGVVFTSASAILIRWAEAHPLVTAFWRMTIAAVLSWPLVLRRGRLTRERVPAGGTRLMFISGLCLAIHFASWISAVTLTSVAHATVLVTLHPVLVLVAARALEGRMPTGRRTTATLVAVAGAVVLAFGGSSSGRSPSLAGDLLAFLGAASFAAYLMIGSRVRRAVSAARYSARVYTIAAIALLIPALLTPGSLVAVSRRDIAIFVALALVCTILGHSVFNWALARIDARDVSASILLEPLIASVAAAFLFGEVPGTATVAGGLLVIGALAVVLAERAEVAQPAG